MKKDSAYSKKMKQALPYLRKFVRTYKNASKAAYKVQRMKRFSMLNYNYLRNWTWRYADENGIYSISKKTHRTDSEHGMLLTLWKKKLQRAYIVEDNQKIIQDYMRWLGSLRSNPDLMAMKPRLFRKVVNWVESAKLEERFRYKYNKNQIMLVEIVDKGKKGITLNNQIRRYTKVGSLTVVFPFSVKDVEFRGT